MGFCFEGLKTVENPVRWASCPLDQWIAHFFNPAFTSSPISIFKNLHYRTGGLGQHFHPSNNLGCSYDHLQVTFIEKVKHGDEAMLAKQELYWQYQLRSFRENGGNAMNIKDDLV